MAGLTKELERAFEETKPDFSKILSYGQSYTKRPIDKILDQAYAERKAKMPKFF